MHIRFVCAQKIFIRLITRDEGVQTNQFGGMPPRHTRTNTMESTQHMPSAKSKTILFFSSRSLALFEAARWHWRTRCLSIRLKYR